MKFSIYAIELHNFKCFRGDHTFEFPQEPGLYHFTGKNLHNPRLGANGVGKSTVIDAINWVLFGRTSRGLKANDIISWGEKSASVALTLGFGDKDREISRSQKPNKILIDGEPKSQEDIDDLIRLNQEAFNASVIIPQFNESFFDLPPAKKLAMFSKIMDLDYWLDKADLAKEHAMVIWEAITDAERRLSNKEGGVESLKANIEALEKFDEEFEVKKIDDRTELEYLIEKIKRALSKAKKRYAKSVVNSDGYEKRLLAIDKQWTTARKELNELANQRGRISGHMSSLKSDVRNLQSDIDEIASMEGDRCPTCLQVVDKNHVKKHDDKVSTRQAKLSRQIKKLAKSDEALAKKETKLKKRISDYREEANDLARERDKLLDADRKAKQVVRDIERDLKDAKGDLDKVNNEKNPYKGLIEKDKKRIKVAKADIKALKATLEELKEKHEAVSYWVGGFKRVRLFVIEDAILNLEIEVNNLLVSLGLPDWRITLDVERENKSGGVTKGFSVIVHSPKTDEPVRWEAFSGGETQRLRLAGDLGLSNLIMERAGFSNTIEMLDEPSEHMSPEGIEDLVDTLHHRAVSSGRIIWLVEHSAVSFGDFAGKLLSTMGEDGYAHFEYKRGQ